MRNRRYNPGKGWIKVIDHGNEVIWFLPQKDGCGITIYNDYSILGPGLPAGWAEIWTVFVPRGSELPLEVLDKTHRIRWCLGPKETEYDFMQWGVTAIHIDTVPASHTAKQVRKFGPYRHGSRWGRPWRQKRRRSYPTRLQIPRKVWKGLALTSKEKFIVDEFWANYQEPDFTNSENITSTKATDLLHHL